MTIYLATQETIWSPVILNGSGFGLFANHSLVMANYLARANAAVINLRELLDQGYNGRRLWPPATPA